MAKPSKRRWAVEKRERRVLAQQEKAQRVAQRLLGVKVFSRDKDLYQQYRKMNQQWFCKDHAPNK
jgi:hypothetical protein